ncbi:adenylosuccinate lyase [Winogradskyella aurantiaca]|uniref:adenylosuccinate lyase n=1 Tax=Winogradskyella aurantiaca TaxID=2219558 RepID=UPI000E1DC8CF|nr:adenylosuccinate lyase [Winogradskyella aurantiaca]
MTKAELISELDHVNHSKEKRTHYSNYFINHPEAVPVLLEVAFDSKIKTSYKAAWVLEFLCSSNIKNIAPHLDFFTKHLTYVKFDSSKRPMAKICERIALDYYKHNNQLLIKVLTPQLKERIIEACFDWMIQNEKVAVKAYSMNALYLFGTDYDWIHPELVSLLKKDFSVQSAAFRARARHILSKLKAS